MNAPAEVLPGQIPLVAGPPRTAAVLAALLSRTRGRRVDLEDELDCPELVQLRRRRRRRARR